MLLLIKLYGVGIVMNRGPGVTQSHGRYLGMDVKIGNLHINSYEKRDWSVSTSISMVILEHL